jgi:hypothetical protein
MYGVTLQGFKARERGRQNSQSLAQLTPDYLQSKKKEQVIVISQVLGSFGHLAWKHIL